MALQNSTNAYGSIAKCFHWLTALLFAISYCAIYYREWFAQSDFESWLTIQLHFSIGLSLFVIVLLRLIWRRLNTVPKPANSSIMLSLIIKCGHRVLYLIMLSLPISGYLSLSHYLTCGSGVIQYFFLFNLNFLKRADLCLTFSPVMKSLESPAAMIHSAIGEWLATGLILGHVFAALYHHFIIRDNTLLKITTQKSH